MYRRHVFTILFVTRVKQEKNKYVDENVNIFSFWVYEMALFVVQMSCFACFTLRLKIRSKSTMVEEWLHGVALLCISLFFLGERSDFDPSFELQL